MPSEFGVVSTSAGDMFLGAFLPGLVLVGLYMAFILGLALIRPRVAPAVHFEGSFDRKFVMRVLLILVPPLTLIFVVLGSIITGVATVNQAGAIGAVGATIMAGYRLSEGRKGAFTPAILIVLSLLAIFVITQSFDTNIKNIKTGEDAFGITLGVIAVMVFLVSVIWSGWRTLKIGDTLRGVMVETAKTTSLVFIILLGAAMLTAAFRGFGGEDLVREFLTGLPGGFWMQFVIVMAVIFVLGFFLDFIEIAVVVVPIVAPILLMDPSANVTAVWLGVMIGLNIQTSFLTPPFGFALFYLRGVAPAIVKTVEMYRGVIAFITLQLLALVIVAFFPALVNYLPNRMSLTSETAPPPLNPRLQLCMERYVFAEYDARAEDLRAEIARVRGLDLDDLPAKLRKATGESFDKAERTFALVEEVRRAEAAVDARKNAFRPLHREVRKLEARIGKINHEVQELSVRIDRIDRNGDAAAEENRDLQAQIDALEAERARLKAAVPATWETTYQDFAAILDAEKKARLAYRRNVDGAYEPVRDLVAIVADVERLAELEEELTALIEVAADEAPAEAAERIAEVMKRVGEVEETRDIRSPLTEARRALRAKTPDPAKALDQLEEALRAYREDLAWRQMAFAELLPELQRYEAAIRNTIGLRQQRRLPKKQALEVAACNAVPEDISLYF